MTRIARKVKKGHAIKKTSVWRRVMSRNATTPSQKLIVPVSHVYWGRGGLSEGGGAFSDAPRKIR